MDILSQIHIPASNLIDQASRILMLAVVMIIIDYDAATHASEQSPKDFQGRSFSIYVLSRGKGVPDDAWQVLEKMRKMFASQQADNLVVRVKETRIGLEGERRLCAEFVDETAARAAWCRAKTIIGGVELVNLRAGPCSP